MMGVKAHVNQAIYNTESALRALDAVGSGGWGINYDASHLYRVGDDVVRAAEKLGKRLAVGEVTLLSGASVDPIAHVTATYSIPNT